MYNEIKVLQEFSKKVFDMTPITIKQLIMIKKEFNNYKKNKLILIKSFNFTRIYIGRNQNI